MKLVKYVLLLVLLVIGSFHTLAYAQNKTHLVKRGETLETIAQLYGITAEQLKAHNPHIRTFYSGITINLPENVVKREASEIKEVSVAEKYLSMGKQYLEKGNGSEAQKMFKKSLDIHMLPEAAYLQGICAYNDGDWKKAENYFSMALSDKGLSDNQASHAAELKEKTAQYLEERAQERSERWGNFLAGVGAGLYVAAQNMQQQQANAMWSSNVSSGYTGQHVGADVYNQRMLETQSDQMFLQQTQAQLNQIFNMSVQQATFQMQQEEENRRQQYQQYVKRCESFNIEPQSYLDWASMFMESDRQRLQEMKEFNEQQSKDFRESLDRDRKDRIARNKEFWNIRNGGSSTYTSSSSSTTASTHTTSTAKDVQYNTGSTYSSQTEGEVLDSKEQYRNKHVSSADYYETNQRVNLYRRDMDKAILQYSNMPVYEKQARKFIYIDGTFYPIAREDWGRFNHYIHYRFKLYLQL